MCDTKENYLNYENGEFKINFSTFIFFKYIIDISIDMRPIYTNSSVCIENIPI